LKRRDFGNFHICLEDGWKWNRIKWDGESWTGFIWLSTGTGGGLLWMR